ncbi:MAG: NUDIX hydrolase [bacterium]|nr:MAG: NUDIX hydrolase [bacterium]
MLKEAVRAIIATDQNEVLLVKRADGIEKDKYCLPGGKVDVGETNEQAVTREIKEELGLDFDPKDSFMISNDSWKTTYFTGNTSGQIKIDTNEVSGVVYLSGKKLDTVDIAFDHKSILEDYFYLSML